MKGFTLFNKATSTGCKLTDKQKLFVMLVTMFGPIPAKDRADRLVIATEFECSERTVYRVLSGVKASVEIDFDNKSKSYKLSNSRPSLFEQVKDHLRVKQITDKHVTVKDPKRQTKTMPLDPNSVQTEDEHACPSAFGKMPEGFLRPCLLCPVDEECLKATQAACRDADRHGQAETMPLDPNPVQTEDEHACPSAFGKMPEGFPIHCVLCPVDEECLKATQAACRDDDRQGQAETMSLDPNSVQLEDRDVPLNCPREFGKRPNDLLIPCLFCPIDEDCLAATKSAYRMEG